ncbi:hypothetical protein Sde_3945 [Saccharophagus degradans 2-40]|uniref:Rhamnogalacturonan lyase domain-containing protein n=2 Tax=Saccharophagus degradans TaxID=86304 RepID=Q21DM9_SACD2|nr:hypothetical protein Sde_3945 [Saccharophagus degradans 2-40]
MAEARGLNNEHGSDMTKKFRWQLVGIVVAIVSFGCASNAPEQRVITPESLAYVGPLLKIDEPPLALNIATPPQVDTPVEQTIPTKITSPPVPRAQENAKQAVQTNPQQIISVKQASLLKEELKLKAEVEIIDDYQQPPAKVTPRFNLLGNIKVLGKNGEPIEVEGTIVTFKPLDDQRLPAMAQSAYHEVGMQDKTYQPRFLAINARDSVSFVNKDEIKHNVFSSTGKNAFDLGTYGPKLRREVQLQAEGIVKVYCNIHPEMASFIAVNNNTISTVSDSKTGRFMVADMPLGKYEIRVWNIRGEVTRTVLVTSSNYRNIQLTLDTASYQPAERKNKFGNRYKQNTALFEDEFY